MDFGRKIGIYGVLSRILLPTGLRVFCANFFGQKVLLTLVPENIYMAKTAQNLKLGL